MCITCDHNSNFQAYFSDRVLLSEYHNIGVHLTQVWHGKVSVHGNGIVFTENQWDTVCEVHIKIHVNLVRLTQLLGTALLVL